jgi:hypothetical protein
MGFVARKNLLGNKTLPAVLIREIFINRPNNRGYLQAVAINCEKL